MSAPGNTTTFRLQVQGDQQVIQKFKQVAQSMQQIDPAAKKAQQSTTQTGNALKSTGQAATSSTSGLKSYHGSLTSLGSANSSAAKGTEAFTGSLNQFSAENTKAKGGLDSTNISTEKFGSTATKTQGAMGKLTDAFRGNRGLIFSVTMLSSGISEAISMFQGYQDASEKLASAKEKVAEMEQRGLEHTKEYGQAVKEAEDAQRGFNFIQRFTIQSFADLAPMSLMLTSSLLDMTGKVGGLSAAKAKLAGILPKVATAARAMGVALWTALTAHPILAVITLISGAVIALITNFGGFRDAVNGIGVAIGKVIPGLQGALKWFGDIMNGAMDAAKSFLSFGQTATAATTDVEKQVLQSGDATKLSYQEQIDMMNKLGEEADDLYFSLGAHMKKQVEDQQQHNEKYNQFVDAIQSGNQNIINSLGLTKEEYKTFYEQWIAEIEAFDTKFSGHVDTIVQNYQKFGEEARKSQEGLIEDYTKLTDKLMEHYKKRDEGEKMDKEARREWRNDLGEIMGDIDQLTGKVSGAAFESADAWSQFGTTTSEMWEKFRLETVSGNFQAGIDHILTAADGVPDKYRQNFDPLLEIITNPLLSAQAKADIVVAHMNELDPYKSFVVGATEYTRKQAEVASSLDELAVSARANVTDTDGMTAAWNKFVSLMNQEQKNLPIVKSAIEGVATGSLSAQKAFAMVEAAGRTMSATLGTTVTQAFTDLEKLVIKMPDGTNQAFTTIQGQVVNLGKVTDAEIVSGGKSMKTSFETLSSSAQTEFQQKIPQSITDLATQGKAKFLELDTSLGTLGTSFTNMTTTTKTETGNWLTDIQNFVNSAGQSLGGAADWLKGALGGAWDFLTGKTTMSLQTANAEMATTGQNMTTLGTTAQTQIGTNTANAITTSGTTAQTAFGQVVTNANLVIEVFKAVGLYADQYINQGVLNATSQASAAFVTMETSMKGTLTRISASFEPSFSQLYPITTRAAGLAIGEFGKMQTQIQQILNTISNSFGPALTPLSNTARTVTTNASGSFHTFQQSVRSSMSQASSAIKSFSSSAVSSLRAVESAARRATSALNSMAAAARKAAQARASVGGLEHGGSFFAMGQHGFNGVVNRPTTYRGVRMGEGFKPEMITVQPLTRGTGNHLGPTVSSSPTGGGGQQLVSNITVVLDGRVIQRFVQKSVLNNIGLQV